MAFTMEKAHFGIWEEEKFRQGYSACPESALFWIELLEFALGKLLSFVGDSLGEFVTQCNSSLPCM